MNPLDEQESGAPVGEPSFLTVVQVASLLQVSEKSVFRWAGADSSMPVLRIGRTLRFDRERLLRWLRAKTQGFGHPRAHKRTHKEGASDANT